MLAILNGDPAAVERAADGLTRAAEQLRSIQTVLASVTTASRWESPAGDRFRALAGQTPPVLDRVIGRYAGAAAALRQFAREFGAAQAESTRAVSAHRRARERSDAYVVALGNLGPPVSPADVAHQAALDRHQKQAVEEMWEAERAHSAAWRRFREADQACTARLRALAADILEDTTAYRVVAQTSRAAGGAEEVSGAVAAVAPGARPVLGVLEFGVGAVRLGSDTVMWGVYGDVGGRELLGTAAALVLPEAADYLRWAARAGGIRRLDQYGPAPRTAMRRHLAQGWKDYAANGPWRPHRELPPPPGDPPGTPVLAAPPAAPKGAPLRERAAAQAARARHAARQQATAVARRELLDDWALATRNGRNAQILTAGHLALKHGENVNGSLGKARDLTPREERQRE